MRKKIIASGKYTDAIDEVLLKIIGAKQKRLKVISKEVKILWKSTIMMKAMGCGMSCKVTIICRV